MRSGVGAALRARGGDDIEAEAMSGGRRALGECVPTRSGALKCRAVLHAVSAWKEASCIGRTFQRALLVAEELGLKTLAVPALGTGNARVSPETCAYAMASALHWHTLLGGSRLAAVDFVLYNADSLEVFIDEFNGVLLDAAGAQDREATGAPRSPEEAAHADPIAETVLFEGPSGERPTKPEPASIRAQKRA
jgi:O-acetyl-ADP-ribose deacetylase (regulator of RNase III)